MPKKIGYVNHKYSTYRVYQPSELHREGGAWGREYYDPARYSTTEQSIFDSADQSNFEQVIEAGNELVDLYDELKNYDSTSRYSGVLQSGDFKSYGNYLNSDIDAYNRLHDRYLKTKNKLGIGISWYSTPIFARSHDKVWQAPQYEPKPTPKEANKFTQESFEKAKSDVNEALKTAYNNASEVNVLLGQVSRALDERKNQYETSYSNSIKASEEKANREAREREAQWRRDEQKRKDEARREKERKNTEILALQKENARNIKKLSVDQADVIKTLNEIQRQIGPRNFNFSRPASSFFSSQSSVRSGNVINEPIPENLSMSARIDELDKRQTASELKAGMQKIFNENDITNIVDARISQLHHTNIPANVSGFQDDKLERSSATGVFLSGNDNLPKQNQSMKILRDDLNLSLDVGKYNQSQIEDIEKQNKSMSIKQDDALKRLNLIEDTSKLIVSDLEDVKKQNKSMIYAHNLFGDRVDKAENTLKALVKDVNTDRDANKSALATNRKLVAALDYKINVIDADLRVQKNLTDQTFSATKHIPGMQEEMNKQGNAIKAVANAEKNNLTQIVQVKKEAASNKKALSDLKPEVSAQRKDVNTANMRSKLNAAAIEALNKTVGDVKDAADKEKQDAKQNFENIFSYINRTNKKIDDNAEILGVRFNQAERTANDALETAKRSGEEMRHKTSLFKDRFVNKFKQQNNAITNLKQDMEKNQQANSEALIAFANGIDDDINALGENLDSYKRTTVLEQQKLHDQLMQKMDEGIKGVKTYNNIQYRTLYDVYSNDKALLHKYGTRATHAKKTRLFDVAKKNLIWDFATSYAKNVA